MTKASSGLSVVVADDDHAFLKIVEHHIRSWSFGVDCVQDKTALYRLLAERRPDLMLLDVRFGEHDGLEVLQQVLTEYRDLEVVMLTAFGSIDNAIAALKLGAVDYLTKPVDLNRLRNALDHIYNDRKAPALRVSRAHSAAPAVSRPILGESQAIKDLIARINRAAPTGSTILILGESGTGKELVARAIHAQSDRSGGPFIPLNVAALPRELVESTLFGHVKGSFTGADQMQSGCCEAASGGTLFLDEIGEMEISLQAKLLRFLQEKSFQRVGQSEPVSVDVRIVAATNRDPLEQIRRGQLREDLYYRLNVVPLVLPPLRDRRDDIPLLARRFVERCSSRFDRRSLSLTDSALQELMSHNWPGNVRELENVIERLAIMTPGPMVDATDIRSVMSDNQSRSAHRHFDDADMDAAAPITRGPHTHLLRPIDRIEYQAISEALAITKGNVREAAKRLGLGQATIYRKIKKYSIPSAIPGD
jgi:DNA-binding NtrC family response regulator